MTLGFDMIQYDTTNLFNLTAGIVDVGVYTVISVIVGGVIGAVVGKSGVKIIGK